MAYADAQSLQQRSAGIAGAALAHVAIGGLIVVGLTVTGTMPDIMDDGPIDVFDIKDPPPPLPPDTPPEPKPDTTQAPKEVFVQEPITALSDNTPFERTIPDLPDHGPIDYVVPRPLPDPTPGLGAIQPSPAIPRNDPSRWIRDSDYKTRWVREGLSGRASFALDIGTDGRVANCTITRSTGHVQLDRATCALITKRARFKPGMTSDGQATTGAYSSAIHWDLPD